jgi:hypothetical protein
VAERFNAPVLKTGGRKPTWVRIPPPPLGRTRLCDSCGHRGFGHGGLGVTRNVTRGGKAKRLRDALEVGCDIGIIGVKLRVPHGHGDVLVPELALKQVERHPGSGQRHGGRVAMVVDSVVVDASQAARSFVLGLYRPARDREELTGAIEAARPDMLDEGAARPVGYEHVSHSGCGLGVAD